MKIFTLFVFCFLFAASHAHAGGHHENLPVCTDEPAVMPCQFDANAAKNLAIQMILENVDGYTQVRTTGQSGLDFLKDGVSVILMSEVQAQFAHSTTVKKYELKFSDSLGSDEDFGRYLWTVIATTVSDGYTYKTTFTNAITKL